MAYLVSLIVFLNSLVIGALKPPFLSRESIVWIWSQSEEKRHTEVSAEQPSGTCSNAGREGRELSAAPTVQGKLWRPETRAWHTPEWNPQAVQLLPLSCQMWSQDRHLGTNLVPTQIACWPSAADQAVLWRQSSSSAADTPSWGLPSIWWSVGILVSITENWLGRKLFL